MLVKPVLRLLLLFCLNAQGQEIGAESPASKLLSKAHFWEGRSRPDFARESLQKLFRLVPDHGDGLATLARIEIEDNQPKPAREVLTKLRRAHPKHLKIRDLEILLRVTELRKPELKQARLLAKAGRTQEALKAIHALFQGAPPAGAFGFEYWQLMAEQGDRWKEALKGLQELSAHFPENQRYHLALLEHQAIRMPADPQVLNGIIGYTLYPEFSRQATASWRRTLKRLPDNAATLALFRTFLASHADDSGMQSEYQRMSSKINQQRLRRADPHYRMIDDGLEYLAAGDDTSAEPLLVAGLKVRPSYAEGWGGLGLIRLRQGRHGEAHELLLKALRGDPDNTEKWRSLANTAHYWQHLRDAQAAIEAGQFDNAKKHLKALSVLDTNEVAGRSAWGDWAAGQQLWKLAERYYRQALTIDPLHSNSLYGLLRLWQTQGDEQQTLSALQSLSRPQQQLLAAERSRIEAARLRKDADLALTEERLEYAAVQLQQALSLDPNNPWLRFDLAQLHVRLGREESGHDLLSARLSDPQSQQELHYAYGLFLASLDQDQAALASVSQIPPSERSAGMNALLTRINTNITLREVEQQNQTGERAAAIERLQQLEQNISSNDEQLLRVARAWSAMGEHQQALRLLETLITGDPEPPVALYLLKADWRLAVNPQQDLIPLIGLIGQQSFTDAEHADFNDLTDRWLQLQMEQAIEHNRPTEAQSAIERYRLWQPEADKSRYAQLQLASLRQQWPEVAAGYQALIKQHPEVIDYRQQLVDTLLKLEQPEAAKAAIVQTLAALNPNDSDVRLGFAKRLSQLDEENQAERLVQRVLSDQPNNIDALYLAGQLAQRRGELELARNYFQQGLQAGGVKADALSTPDYWLPAKNTEADSWPVNAMKNNLRALRDSRNGHLWVGIDLTSRKATKGESQTASVTMPMELRLPTGQQDFWFMRLEPVDLNAGRIDLTNPDNEETHGSMLLCSPCGQPALARTATGVGFGLGYEHGSWRFDLGLTPRGFLVEDWVGGILKKGDWQDYSWSFDLSRRPQTSSLLSYAGMRDLNSGQVWGGVRTLGVSLGLSHDQGGSWGYWSNLGGHQLTGQNVASNQRLQLMGGAYHRLINEDNRQLRVGATAIYLNFAKDLGEFTFGQGGYYSPQQSLSLSMPLSYYAREGRWSYLLRGTISISTTQDDTTAYYPQHNALQQDAELLAAGGSGVDPFFRGGSGGGLGQSLRAAVEYKATSRLFVGGHIALENADYYKPLNMQFYFRYLLNPTQRAASMPPEPIPLYSDF